MFKIQNQKKTNIPIIKRFKYLGQVFPKEAICFAQVSPEKQNQYVCMCILYCIYVLKGRQEEMGDLF